MIQSVDKALRLLQALDLHGDWIGVRELARQLQLSPPSVHNLLRTLVAASFVETNPATRQYRLGLAAIRLGAGFDPLNHMRLLARPYIEELARDLDETVVVCTWQHSQAVVVDWIQGRHPLSVTHHHGIIADPFVFASSRVLLAWQSEDIQARLAAAEPLDRLGPNGPRSADELRAQLAQIREVGCAVTENVGHSGVIAVGAPVFDANRQLLFAIGCSAPISRTPPERVERVRSHLLATTATLTQRLAARTATPAA